MNSMSDLLGPARLLATPIQDVQYIVQGNSVGVDLCWIILRQIAILLIVKGLLSRGKKKELE